MEWILTHLDSSSIRPLVQWILALRGANAVIAASSLLTTGALAVSLVLARDLIRVPTDPEMGPLNPALSWQLAGAVLFIGLVLSLASFLQSIMSYIDARLVGQRMKAALRSTEAGRRGAARLLAERHLMEGWIRTWSAACQFGVYVVLILLLEAWWGLASVAVTVFVLTAAAVPFWTRAFADSLHFLKVQRSEVSLRPPASKGSEAPNGDPERFFEAVKRRDLSVFRTPAFSTFALSMVAFTSVLLAGLASGLDSILISLALALLWRQASIGLLAPVGPLAWSYAVWSTSQRGAAGQATSDLAM